MKTWDVTGAIKELNEDEIKVFTHSLFGDLHVIDYECQRWFRLTDIDKNVGLTKNIKRVLFRQLTFSVDYIEPDVIYENGCKSKTVFVSEGALYRFLLEGDAKLCDTFRWWLSEEVLPLFTTWERFNLDNVADFITAQARMMHVASKVNDNDGMEQCASSILYKIAETGSREQGLFFSPAEKEWLVDEIPHVILDQKIFHRNPDNRPDWLVDIMEHDDRMNAYDDYYDDPEFLKECDRKFMEKIDNKIMKK